MEKTDPSLEMQFLSTPLKEAAPEGSQEVLWEFSTPVKAKLSLNEEIVLKEHSGNKTCADSI